MFSEPCLVPWGQALVTSTASRRSTLVADGFDLAEYKRVEENGEILVNIDANASTT